MFWPAIIYTLCNAVADRANNRPTPKPEYTTGYSIAGHEMPKETEDKIVKYVNELLTNDVVAWNVFDRLDKFHRYYPQICSADYYGGWRAMLSDGKIDSKEFNRLGGSFNSDGLHGKLVSMLCLTYGKISRSYSYLYKEHPLDIPLFNIEIDQSLLPELICFYDDAKFFMKHGRHKREGEK